MVSVTERTREIGLAHARDQLVHPDHFLPVRRSAAALFTSSGKNRRSCATASAGITPSALPSWLEKHCRQWAALDSSLADEVARSDVLPFLAHPVGIRTEFKVASVSRQPFREE